MYLLPAIDILGGKAVRLAKGDYNQVTVYNDDPVAQARVFEQAGAQWVHVVDLDGARSGVLFRIAVLDQCFGVVFDVTGELISQIVRLVSRQAADLREHAIAILVSVHSLTLF